MERLPESVKAVSGFIVVCKKCEAKFICTGPNRAIKLEDDRGGYDAYLTCPSCGTESHLPPVPDYTHY